MPRRPDPDALLEQVRAEEARAKRGQLKVFFGASPGVGKTFTMLEAATAKRVAGLDVVIGWSKPMGGRRPAGCSKASRSSLAAKWSTGAPRSRSSTSMRRWCDHLPS